MGSPREHERDPAANLRKRAEARIDRRVNNLPMLSPGEVQELVHELDVYCAELEVQNEELRDRHLETEMTLRGQARCGGGQRGQRGVPGPHEPRPADPHEHAVLGMMEIVLLEELPPAVRDCLETAKDSADKLLMRLNDILDFSRIEAGGLTLEQSPFHLGSLLDETIRLLEPLALRKGLRLLCEHPEAVPRPISWRRHAPATDPHEPRQQRDQVHREGPSGRARVGGIRD